MKCSNCGFEAHISQWTMVEKNSFVKVPQKTLNEYDAFVDSKKENPLLLRELAKFLMRALGESGLMPCHQTDYVCPNCGKSLNVETRKKK